MLEFVDVSLGGLAFFVWVPYKCLDFTLKHCNNQYLCIGFVFGM